MEFIGNKHLGYDVPEVKQRHTRWYMKHFAEPQILKNDVSRSLSPPWFTWWIFITFCMSVLKGGLSAPGHRVCFLHWLLYCSHFNLSFCLCCVVWAARDTREVTSAEAAEFRCASWHFRVLPTPSVYQEFVRHGTKTQMTENIGTQL